MICIDRPGRGRSDPVPSPEGADTDAGASPEAAARSQAFVSEAIEAAVVDTVKQVSPPGGGRLREGWRGGGWRWVWVGV